MFRGLGHLGESAKNFQLSGHKDPAALPQPSSKREGEFPAAATDDAVKARVRHTLFKNIARKRPTDVHVGYKILSIADVDSIRCSFLCEFKLHFFWTDMHFVGRDPKAISLDEVGALRPDISITNARNLTMLSSSLQLKNPKRGELKLSAAYRGELMVTDMDLTYFPFDVQVVGSHRTIVPLHAGSHRSAPPPAPH